MKKKILPAFFLTFIFSFLFYSFVSGVLFALPGMSISELGEMLLVLASAPFLLGLAVAYSVSQMGASEEIALGVEIAEGASNAIRAIALLASKAFHPVWVIIGLSAFGIFLIQIEFTILGVVAIFVTQVWWVSSRRKMHTLVSGKNVAPSLVIPLRFFIYVVDAFCVWITVTVLAVLSKYAQITNPTKILGLSLVISIGLVAYWYRLNRLSLEILFGIKVMVVFVWVLLVSMVINYGLDFRGPTKVHIIAFGDCPDRKNKYFTNKNEKIDPSLGAARFEGCEIFDSVASPNAEDKAETIYRAGALGVAWKKTRLTR